MPSASAWPRAQGLGETQPHRSFQMDGGVQLQVLAILLKSVGSEVGVGDLRGLFQPR